MPRIPEPPASQPQHPNTNKSDTYNGDANEGIRQPFHIGSHHLAASESLPPGRRLFHESSRALRRLPGEFGEGDAYSNHQGNHAGHQDGEFQDGLVEAALVTE